MIADVRVRVALGAEELVIRRKTQLLLVMTLETVMMLVLQKILQRRLGMDVRTTARAVYTDHRVGTRVVHAARLVQVSHFNQRHNVFITHWLYAGPSCTICQFWLFAGQCKSIADQRKLYIVTALGPDLIILNLPTIKTTEVLLIECSFAIPACSLA